LRPEIRSGHTNCLFDDFIFIFGGIYEVTKELNDIYAYSIEKNRWFKISDVNSSPIKKKVYAKDL